MEQFLMYLNKDDEYNKSDEKECLITGDWISIRDGIELDCKHFFKYDALMKEIDINKGKVPQIKCPYCRSIFKGVLPYREGYLKQHNVNYPLKYCIYKNECSRIISRGKRKGQKCGKSCEFEKCIRCSKEVPSPNKQCAHMINVRRCKLYVKKGEYCHHHVKKEEANMNKGT